MDKSKKMKSLEKDYNLHVRVSKQEITKYKEAASELGMTVSTLTRFALNKQLRLLRTKREDQITLK